MIKLTNLQKVRAIIVFFMVALVVSGATAFPVESELKLLCSVLNINAETIKDSPAIFGFVYSMKESITEVNLHTPQLAYGYDWLAFAHLVIALMFIGPFRDPVRNKWVIQWGMIACVAILPLAFICGPIREMPLYWTFIDCSFGVFGIIPLILCMKYIKLLEKEG
ncbi:MAG: hypothetical protein IK131_08660 [Paludibacteraceae bacterium]|nr:hypothetical protein [Paludibacteraceae bacterium]